MKKLIVLSGTILMLINAVFSYGQFDFNSHKFYDNNLNSIDIVDYDKDGHKDIVGGVYSKNKILWFKSDGEFAPGFEENVVLEVSQPAFQKTLDFDGDGDLDVVVQSRNLGLLWFENDGNNSFTQHEINPMTNLKKFVVLDFNGDGKKDVVGFTLFDNNIFWWKHNGESPPSFTQYEIEDYYKGLSDIDVVDFDGDGSYDVIASSSSYGNDDQLVWYENKNSEFSSFNQKVLVHDGDIHPAVIDVKDIDGDGDVDIVQVGSSSYAEFKWFENKGLSPINFEAQTISEYGSGTDVLATDMDSDGDIDFLTGSSSDGLKLWENDGAMDLSFIKHDVVGTRNQENIVVSDINGDGDNDIFSTTWTMYKTFWLENNAPIGTVITKQPDNVNKCEKSSVSFLLEALGTGLSFQWQKDGTDISGATESTYSIAQLKLSDAGVYTCVVTGNGGTVTSNPATLTVKELIEITTQPNTITKIEDETTEFSVSATGTISSYQWYKDGAELSDGTNVSGSKTPTLTITNVAKSNNGDYTCKLSGECNEITSDAASLTVYKETSITSQPNSMTTCEETSVTFSVDATGDNLTYQWTKDGIKISGAALVNYLINNVTTVDAGEYKCEVTGDGGTKVSNAAILTVNQLIQITTQPQSVEAGRGKEAKFSVLAEGTIDTYQWNKDGAELTDGGKFLGSITSELTISDIATSENGDYTVKISGVCGDKVSDKATLSVLTSTFDLQEAGISISPNPSSDHIKIISTNKKIEKIEIYNQEGKLLIQKSMDFNRLDVSGLVNGVYFVKVIVDGDVGVKKIVIER